jgi:hypothetical protein
MDRRPSVHKRVEGDRVYFTISWSPLRKSDKYDIVKSVPSEAGLYELYSMDEKGKLNLFHVGKSWYGGLRNEIRQRTDPELEDDAEKRARLEDSDCWYRWTLVSSSEDMADILWFFGTTYFPGRVGVKPSGRYAAVFVKEVDADRIVTI